MGGTELKSDAWHRYVMYRSDDSAFMPFASREERLQAGEAGRKFTASAYPDVWAKDAALVARVRQFLDANFHWHRRLTKNGTAQEVVQTLHDMVRGGSVIVSPEKAPGGGSVGNAPPAISEPVYAALDPEDAEQMRAFARSILYPPGEPVLSGDYSADREATGQLAAAKVAMSGDDGSVSTLLGDAQPFEYTPDAVSGDETQTAWMPIDGGPPNTWMENPSGSGQLRFFDGNGNAAIDIDYDHDHGFGSPHWHSWTDGVRDKGNPMSTITY